MEQHPTAGARIRMTLEGIVRDAYQGGIFTLGDGTHVSYTPGQHVVTVLAAGWEPGDMIDTEHGVLTRVVQHGYAFWRCMESEPPRDFHDDQVRTDDLRVILRVTPQPEQAPAPAVDHTARWHAVEALVTRAREKGVSRIDTDLIADALGLDEVAAPAPAADELAPDTYRLSMKAPAAPAPVDPHNYVAKWQSEAAAKRRLPDCKTCDQPANATAHDGDHSETTSLYRMLLNA